MHVTRGAIVVAVVVGACGEPAKLPVATLEDPATCMECHGQHYAEWATSMHAYASDDPVFLAMNKRGQRETGNQLGKFCVQCHAPMAVALGLTDGTNFDPKTLPPQARGITCFFCHDVQSIKDDHNNGLVLALDDTMRGGVHDPVDSPAHHSTYDKTMDSYTNKSQMCGSCHDVTTPRGIPLERSYAEWQTTVFTQSDPARGILETTCSACHMRSDPSTTVIADKPGLAVKSRPNSFHEHLWPAVDRALPYSTDPADPQVIGIKAILDPALIIIGPRPVAGGTPPGGICLDPPGVLTVRMDTISTGHMYPSGAAQDRRVWLEVIAYRADNSIVFQSGVVGPTQDPEDLADPIIDCSSATPMSCSGFWDRTFKDDNSPAHFFWEVARVDSRLLKPPITFVPTDAGYDHSTTASFQVGASYNQIDHITARILTRPFAYSVLDELVMSGDLDASLVPTLETLDSAFSDQTWNVATKGTGASMFTNCNKN